jgi:hypothetical protein
MLFVDDYLPSLWNKKMEEYLGVKVENDAEGILQDIHWYVIFFLCILVVVFLFWLFKLILFCLLD